MEALAPTLFILAALIWGLDTDGVTFFIIPAVVGLVAAFLVRRFGTWAKIFGLVAAVAIGFLLFWTAFGVASPGSFFDFVPGLLVIPGAIIAITGCVAGLRARKDPSVAPSDRETKVVRRITAVLGVLAVVSAILTFTGQESVDGSGANTTVVLKDFEYDQPEYVMPAGSTVLVRNDDPFAHTFTIEDLDIDESISPGSEVLITIPEGESGEYTVFCRPHTSDPDDPSEDDMAAKVDIS
jgi:plastocyanin